MDYKEPEWVADKLGVDKNTVYRFLQDGTIPALQLGRKWLVSERRLDEWLREETDRQTRSRREGIESSARLIRRLENFTASARQALKAAHSEARRYAHEQIDSSHLLLGLAADRESSVAAAIASLGMSPDSIRRKIESRLEAGTSPAPRRLGRTSEAKKAIRLASRLAIRESPGKALAPVGTDHLLLGILLARKGLGHEILLEHNVTRQRLREALCEANKKRSNGEPS
jgi:excisionase family DNA binding protein